MLLFNFEMLIFFIFICVLVPISSQNFSALLDIINNPNSEWNMMENYLNNGTMSGYFTYDEGLNMIRKLSEEYPSYFLNFTSIGKTYENRSIFQIILTDGTNDIKNKDFILFTGLHHAREPLSFSMNLYLIFKFLFLIKHDDEELNQIIKNVGLIFVPAINVDGYFKIEEIYKETSSLSEKIRKNRHLEPNMKCEDHEIGVDLNRNYDFQFAYNDQGSTGYPCNEDFRGKAPFSEPETQAIKKLIEDHNNRIRIAVNFHSYGNLWIIPNNYLDDAENTILKSSSKHFNFYEQFFKEAIFSESALLGNAAKVIGYTANGEASDWMLGEKGIISLSPELGNDNKIGSEKFFPEKEEIFPIMENCFQPISYLLGKMQFLPLIIDISIVANQTSNIVILHFFNDGIIDQKLEKGILKYDYNFSEKNELNILSINSLCLDNKNETSGLTQIGENEGKILEQKLLEFKSQISTLKYQEFEKYYEIHFDGLTFTNRGFCTFFIEIDKKPLRDFNNYFDIQWRFNENSKPLNSSINIRTKTIVPLYQHDNFLVWPMVSLIIGSVLFIILLIIFFVWRRRRGLETIKLLKGARIPNNIGVEEKNHESFVISEEEKEG